ncbi:2983_t:CDS:2, partial [Acaulospora colombiana]
DHHLKHQARLQYGLFLKQLLFGERRFLPRSPMRSSQKSTYIISNTAMAWLERWQTIPREGKSTAMKLSKRLKHDKIALQSTMGISSHDLQDVMNSVKSEHYHVACTRVYELTHGIKRGEGIGGGESVTHPNGYAQRSRELEKARTEAATNEDAMKID